MTTAEGPRLARSEGPRNGATAADEPAGLHPGWYLVAVPVIALVVISAFAYRGLQSVDPVGTNPIQHVIIIVQEGRSFDNYFGTYPGADGIPMVHGRPSVCVPDPATAKCVESSHSNADRNVGGPTDTHAAAVDVEHGHMNGFVKAVRETQRCRAEIVGKCPTLPATDVMGFHDQREIPNYWSYAKHFVLQDRMFEPVASSSLAAHLFLVSGWSALCPRPGDASSCRNDPDPPGIQPVVASSPTSRPTHFAWTDLTYLLHRAGIDWRYYVGDGTRPVCEAPGQVDCSVQG